MASKSDNDVGVSSFVTNIGNTTIFASNKSGFSSYIIFVNIWIIIGIFYSIYMIYGVNNGNYLISDNLIGNVTVFVLFY